MPSGNAKAGTDMNAANAQKIPALIPIALDMRIIICLHWAPCAAGGTERLYVPGRATESQIGLDEFADHCRCCGPTTMPSAIAIGGTSSCIPTRQYECVGFSVVAHQ